MRISTLLLLVLLVAPLLAWGPFSGHERVVVDFGLDRGPARCVAGGLHGGIRDDLPDSLIVPLGFTSVRGRVHSAESRTWERVREMNGTVVLLVTDYVESCGCPKLRGGGFACNTDPHSVCWQRKVDGKVAMVMRNRRAIPDGPPLTIHYDIWNEPDIEMFWAGSESEYLELWRVTCERIRATDPEAIITGPSFSGGFWGSSRTDVDMKDFLVFCRDHRCLPDVLGWHSWEKDEIARDVAEARELLRSLGIPPDSLRFEVNEALTRNEYLQPGLMVRRFADAERAPAGLLFMGRGYWNSWEAGRLSGLLDQEGHRRFAWWTQAAYAEIAGRLVDFRPSNGIDGVAGVDPERESARILFGRHRGSSRPRITLKLENLDTVLTGGRVRITVHRMRGGDREKEAPVVPELLLQREREVTATMTVSLYDGNRLSRGDAVMVRVDRIP